MLQQILLLALLLLARIKSSQSSFEDRPVIASYGGSLKIAASPGKDIKLDVQGDGKVYVGDKDFSAIINKFSSSLQSLLQCSVDSKNALDKVNRLEESSGSSPILTNRMTTIESWINVTNLRMIALSRPLRRRVFNIQRQLTMLMKNINKNECASNPCLNGGTCQDLYTAYTCICPSNWEGPNCEKDVNECTKYKGTELGCQNGAKCENTPGSYECKCAEGWFGVHCTARTQSCNSSADICGHGSCIPLANGYKCLCDQGWKTDGVKAACSVDIDECASYHPPCSSNPPVTCVNLPGTFYCGHCPAGYTGNGFYCSDINECEILNGGCSMYPMVQCVNVPGTKLCGRCPPGYTGNGISCKFEGICANANGGCHPQAQCRDNPRISDTYVECICPSGYSGDGYGPNGCTKGIQDACASNPCLHGTCTSSNIGYICNCTSKYTGRNCDIRKNSCHSNPCANGGTCKAFAFSFYCQCAPGFTGAYCENRMQKCSETLGPQGNFEYPAKDSVSTRKPWISCAWRIKTTNSQVINVTFHEVYLPMCTHNFLQMHDGKDSSTPLLGRFCELKLKNGSSIISTTNNLYFWFMGDGQVTTPYLNISWNSIDPVCGEYSEISESGTFKSPGSPQNYPANRDCYWKFKAPLNKRIKFTFYHLDIGNNADCKRDFISFNEGLELSSKSFFKECKSGVIEPILSPANEVTVHFHTVESHTGFLVHYSLIEGVVGCGGIYTHASGIITSPKIKSNGKDELITCEYRIQLNYESRLRLHFNKFSGSNDNPSCSGDTYLAIYQGNNINSPLAGRYCGSQLPTDLILVDKQALIVFKYYSNANQEFELSYKTVCGGSYTAESSSIQSPGYPNTIAIEKPQECVYMIMRPPGSRIQINIADLDFGNDTIDCSKASLKIFNGYANSQTTASEYCGKFPEAPIYFGNLVTVKYTAKYGTVGGFKLDYTSLNTNDCGGVVTANSGFIESPKNLDVYTDGLNCSWTLSAPPGYMIEMSWLQFNLEQSFQCNFDYVQVFDNATDPGVEVGKYCGNTLPPTMTTVSNSATIVFKIDTLNNYDGFHLSYRFISASSACGGRFFSPSGIIKSPLYPAFYPDNRNCKWILSVPQGQQILLNTTFFHLEESNDCRYDSVVIYNGASNLSPLIGKYCSKKIPKLITSHTNQLTIQFTSDKTKNAPGFVIQWTSTSTGCGGSLTASYGTITSPNYPEPYNRNAECLWRISVSHGSRIRAIFADLELEYLTNCPVDYVEIYDGESTMGKKVGRYCKIESGSPIIESTSNHLVIKFHSDINYQGRGFQLQYSTLCYTNVTGFSGVIENPNYPDKAPPDQNCLWQINVPMGNTIKLMFSEFKMEMFMLNECVGNYMEILQDDIEQYDKGRVSLGKYCSNHPPDEVMEIKSNVAFLKYESGMKLFKSIFRIEWELQGCGGLLNRPSGLFETPNYPDAYPRDTECNWHLQTEFGKTIEITFDKIDMELQRYCGVDYVTVYSGADDTYPVIATFCHSIDKPTVITGTGRDLFVKFVSDSSYTGRGFTANYRTTDTKCGGLLRTSSGTFHSPNFPKNYDRNDSCAWLIEVAENHKIDLVFESVDFARFINPTSIHPNIVVPPFRMNLNDAYVKVYDGPTSAYPILVTIYGTDRPNRTITSSYNHLYVEMVTNPHLTSKGFLARYSTACGATINTEGSGTIEFLASTLASTNVTGNCSWTISTPKLDQHILLTFTHLQAPYCYGIDPIMIYDGENDNSSLIGTYCDKMPKPIRSQGSKLHLLIRDPDDYTKFSAKYTVMESQCGGTFTSLKGIFSSPNYPDSYPVNTQCEWIIHASHGNEIRIDFSTFELRSSASCNEDYLEIRERNRNGKLIGTFCGTDTPINVTAREAIWMFFKSERPDIGSDGITAKGFLAEYNLATSVEITGINGTISSPLYPERLMTQEMFKWQINVASGYDILLEFKEFNFEMTPEYCYGASVNIYDGDENGELLREFCGNGKRTVKSKTNTVLVTLAGMATTRGSRFSLDWKRIITTNGTDHECGGDEFIDAFNTTRELNATFSNRVILDKCDWIYTTSPGRHLQVVFDVLQMNSFMRCNFDKIVISDGNGYGADEEITSEFRNITTFCNRTALQSVVKTQGNSMRIKYIRSFLRNHVVKLHANITDACGGTVERPNGVLIVDGRYEPKLNKTLECEWQITTATGKILQITIQTMKTDVRELFECATKIIVRGGQFKDSPIINTFCSAERYPISVNTTGNSARIQLSGNYTEYFKIRYKTLSVTECGSKIQLDQFDNSAIITSPNYPDAPERDTECVWVISGPRGEALQIDFLERFDLYRGPDCPQEGVEIRDGATSGAKLINVLCGDMPSTQVALRNMMHIRFYTEGVEPQNGFKARVSIAKCGGTYRGMQGTISSPGYGNTVSYPTNVSCTWEIEVSIGHTVNITFETLDISPRATLQTIEVGFLDNKETILYDSIIKPKNVLVAGSNKVRIRFNSGWGPRLLYTGFKLKYIASEKKCEYDITASAGVITSPYYPRGTNTKVTCEWNIRVPAGQRIKLVFNDVDFNLDQPHEQGIACFPSGTLSSQMIFLHANQNNTPNEIQSSDNVMKLYYWATGGRKVVRGFKATYTSDESSICRAKLDQDEGILTQPNETSYSCRWKMQTKQAVNQTLALTINANIVNSKPVKCRFAMNVIHVLEEPAERSNAALQLIAQQALASICDPTPNPVIVRTLLPQPVIHVVRTTKSSAMNFTIKYKLHNCGGEIQDTSGTITSPKRQGVIDCAWKFTGVLGEQHKLQVNTFEMDDCEQSYLLIYNGANERSPLIGKYCGKNVPTHVQSKAHYLWVEYHGSNDSFINITYEKQSKVCGGINSEVSSVIETPSYPASYDNNEECLWELRAEKGYYIHLKFNERFQLEESDHCRNDFVAVSDGVTTTWENATRYCGRQIPPSFNSTGNTLKVLFRSNDRVSGSGFKASWKWECGGEFVATKEPAYIESPGYPKKYGSNLRCQYIIRAPRKYVRVRFEDFELEPSRSCTFDKVIVQAYSNFFFPRSNLLQTTAVHCDYALPKEYRIYQGANITFITDRFVNKRGFKLRYFIDECGGNITEPTVIQESYSVDDNLISRAYYAQRMQCTWNITAPSNKRININFLTLNVTAHINCYSQFVSITEKGKKLAVLCGDFANNTLPTFYSNQNNLVVKFQYLMQYLGVAKFIATIQFTYGPETGCGGFIDMTNTNSKSLSFTPPGDDYDCVWHIQAANDNTIAITFSDSKDLKCDTVVSSSSPANSSCCIYYEFRDGNRSSSDLIYQGCHSSQLNGVQYVTSGSLGLLRIAGLKKDYKVAKISLESKLSICGHLTLTPTNVTQYISTPNFPNAYPENLRCIWRIKSKFINRVHLDFQQFKLNSDKANISHCGDMDRLEIVDRNNKAFHLDYDMIYKRKLSKYDAQNFDGLYGHHSFCRATDAGYDFVGRNSHLQLSFFSDSNTKPRGSGFKIGYKIANCSRDYHGVSGRIPRIWQMGNCTTRIIAPKNYTIALYFNSNNYLQLVCSSRTVDVYDGSDSGNPLLRICGTQKPTPVYSKSNEMIIKLINKSRYGMYSADMTYIASDKGAGCGGFVYMFSGTFMSPKYPDPFPQNTICTWNIQVPLGLQVALYFKWFDIKGSCNHVYVKLRQGDEQAAPQVYCPTDTPAIFTATGSAITVEYKSNTENTGTGWKLSFMAITSDIDLQKFKLGKQVLN